MRFRCQLSHSAITRIIQILTVMLAFAEYERGMIVERTQTGKSVARLNPDFKDGRPRKFTDAQIQLALDLLATGKSYGQVQKMTGISSTNLTCGMESKKNCRFSL